MSQLNVRVARIRQLTPVIREFTFEALDGGRLPGFSAGSHVQVEVPGAGRTLRNAYSLLSDPADTRHYRIAVRLQESSRGGSRYLHQELAVGDCLRLSMPHNLFALNSQARHHVLVAGGIGITPFLAHITELKARGESFELHYAYRGGVTDAYLGELRERLGSALHSYNSLAGERLDISALLCGKPLGTHVYACGPKNLLDALRAQAHAAGWPAERLHWEAFASPEPGLPFMVELAQSGRRIEVDADTSLLEALEEAGVPVPSLCRGGVCGQCETRYLDGEVEHRDHFLSPEERAARLMPCVSRGGCDRPLLLDL